MTAAPYPGTQPKVLDLRRELKPLYTAKAGAVSVIDVPPLSYLMIDGQGDPNDSQLFQDATAALYTTAYSLKFSLKRGPRALDYPVMPLEGLWWSATADFSMDRRFDWRWTLMIMQHDQVSREDLATAIDRVVSQKAVPLLDEVRLERYVEGRSAQILHVGPFVTEPETIERLHAYISANNLRFNGKHHEIYLSLEEIGIVLGCGQHDDLHVGCNRMRPLPLTDSATRSILANWRPAQAKVQASGSPERRQYRANEAPALKGSRRVHELRQWGGDHGPRSVD